MNINQSLETLEKKTLFGSTPFRSHKSTHLCVLLGEEQPQCVGCDASFIVRHSLLACCDFAQLKKCFHGDSMEQLFQDLHIDTILWCSDTIYRLL